MMKAYKLIFFTLIVLLLGACRKDAPELQNPKDQVALSAPSHVFNSFWHGMNNSYAFWSIDPTDWDQIYDEYLPKFQALDHLQTVDTKRLSELYTAITKNLIDHHYILSITNKRAPQNQDYQFEIAPGENEVKTRNYYHDPIYFELIVQAIETLKAQGRITNLEGGRSPGQPGAASYDIDNGIIYLYLEAFNITPLRQSNNAEPDPLLRAVDNFQRMIFSTPNIRGVVIDVRNNSGGSLADMREIVAPMLSQEHLFGYSRTKNGPGRLDYEPWVPCIIAPTAKYRMIEAPIVVLADVRSISMAEMTAMAVQSLPNGYVIGERTWGGTGPLDGDYNISYGGSFTNDAVYVKTSTSILKDVNGNIIEGYGVTPDIEVFYDPEAMRSGTDTQLERVLSFIETGRK